MVGSLGGPPGAPEFETIMHRTAFPLAAAFLTLALAAPAAADTVHLTNGSTLEGKATRQGDVVIVKTRHGEVKIAAAQVRSIVVGKTRHDLYLERVKDLKAEDTDAQVALGDWCEKQKLRS